jgi:uncharacterized membrane protein YccC
VRLDGSSLQRTRARARARAHREYSGADRGAIPAPPDRDQRAPRADADPGEREIVKAVLSWRPSDPGRFALRLALRTAIVLPVALALGKWAGGSQTALFAAFGSFALLLFVDFGGPRPVRLIAYLALAVVCSGLIALGTLSSQDAVAAAVLMLVVGFAILFGGVLNGYVAAAAQAALLSFVLPAMVPADASAIGARLAGWWIAAALAIPASLLLFPARPRDRVRAAVAAACRAAAAQVRAPSPEAARALEAALDRLHERFAATPLRPTGPTGATGALAALVDELDWIGVIAVLPAGGRPVLGPTPGEVELRGLTADALMASAELIAGHAGPPPDRPALEQHRERVLRELGTQLRDPALRADDDLLWSALVRAWEARVFSYITLDVARLAGPAGGVEPGDGAPRWLRFLRAQGVLLAESGRAAAAHADVRSVWFRNSVRGAIGLAIAVLVAGLASVQHAFWVVLGALSVLRSSALNTGASILEALLGTLVGIIAGGLLVAAVGSDATALWIALPFAVMLAAYAPRAVSFAAGQAGFTVALLVIFNLLAPSGWKVGLIRLEDVAIGFAISLAVGVLFWPRGAQALLMRSLDEALATAARYVTGAFRWLVAGADAPPVEPLAEEARAASDRLDVAFRQRLAERRGGDPRLAARARLASAAARLRVTADGIAHLAARIGAAPRPRAAHSLPGDAARVADWYVALGAGLGGDAGAPAVPPLDPTLQPALVAALRAASGDAAGDGLAAATAVAWGELHLEELTLLAEALAGAAGDAPRRGRADSGA